MVMHVCFSSLMITEQCPRQLCDMHRSQACSDVATFHIGALSLAHSILRAALEVSVDDFTASAEEEDGSDHGEDDEGHGLQIKPHSSQKIIVEKDVIDYGVNFRLTEMSDPAQKTDGSSPAANVQWERRKALPPSTDAMRTPPPVAPKPWLKSPQESPGSHQGSTGPGREAPHRSSSPRRNSPTTGKTLDHELDVEDPWKDAIYATPSNKQKPPEVMGQCLGFNPGSNNEPGKDSLIVAGSGSSECGAASPKAGQRLSPSLHRPSPPPKPQKLFTAPETEAGGEEEAINEMSNLSKATSSSASQGEEDPGNGKGKENKQEEEVVEEKHFKVISVVAENSSPLGERATLGSVPCAPLGQEAGRPGGGSTGGRVAPFPKPPRRKRGVTLLHIEVQTPQAQSLDSGRRDGGNPGGEACPLTKDAPAASVSLPKTKTNVEAARRLEEPREVQSVESCAAGLLPVPSGFEDPLDGATDQGSMLKMVDRLKDRKEHERQTGGHQEEVGRERQEGGEMALALYQDLPRPIRMQRREEGGGMDQEEGENRGKSEPNHTNAISQSSVSSFECYSPVNPVEELLSGEERSPVTSIKSSSCSPCTRNQSHSDDDGTRLGLCNQNRSWSDPVGETGRTLPQDVFDCNHDNTEDQSVYEDGFPGNQTDARRQEVTGSDGGPIISVVPVTFLSSNEGHMSPRTLNIYETVEFVNPSLLPDISAVKFVSSALDFSVQKYRIGLSRKRKHRPPWMRHFRQDQSSLTLASTLQVFPASIFYKVPDTAVTSQGKQEKDAGTSPKPLVKIMTAVRGTELK